MKRLTTALNSKRGLDAVLLCLVMAAGVLAGPVILILMLCGYYSFQAIGLNRPNSWVQTIAIGIVLGLLFYAAAQHAFKPLALWVADQLGASAETGVGVQLDDSIQGNWTYYLLALMISWVQAAFFEEFVYRGYIQNKVASLFATEFLGWTVAIAVATSLFAVAHWLLRGVASAAFAGAYFVAFSLVYLALGKRLWPIIIAHGLYDTIIFTQRFVGS